MHEIPECLNRRYKALDDLVNELRFASDVNINADESGASYSDPGVKLMCDFWNILKENPDCNLTKAVQNRLDVSPQRSMFQPQRVSCFMAAHNCMKKDEDTNKSESGAKPINECCHRGADPKIQAKCCGSKFVPSRQESSDVLPLSKVLCNLNEAASFDRKCQGMVNDLMAAQKQLQDQIQQLERREKEGIQLLKQADCMWSCMEDAYKRKIMESQERQQELIKQLKEAEANTNKWRKNKKDLEFQMENVNMCHQEISEKLQQKENDLKCMNRDIADYKKRIANNKKELEAAKKAIVTKKRTSDDKINKISGDISRLESRIRDENAHKAEKETEGNKYIRAARADLLNLSKILLQKKIENEEMRTEKETLIDELEILSQTYDQCKDRCKLKKQSIDDEIKKIDKEIANFKFKCIRCHQCTDTIDIRKCCTDCPRCLEERECLYNDDHCSPDHTMDCVCMSVKQKFLDNVFENMYTVLERQIKVGPGKCVAETVLNCLKRSRNGKLDQQTRQVLQDFILTTVKKNLNLTIVGGAVKTRCELDSETYKQLMLCLKQVKVVKPPKADKETAAKKPPCSRWGGESECNCPKGPKACICTKKAPPPPHEPGPCPPPDKEDKGEEKTCPYKESAACGPDCAMHAVPSAVGTDVAAWRPDPCQGPTCAFKNMRAAQCVLGPEALNTTYDSRSFVTAVPHVPNLALTEVQSPCKCGSSPMKLCTCKDIKQMKVDTRIQCDDEICSMQRSNLNLEKSLSPIAKLQSFENMKYVNGEVSTRHSNMIKSDQPNNTEKVTVDDKIKQDLIKEQFQPLIHTKTIQNEKNLFSGNSKETLKSTASKPSAASKTEIDEKIIELIENITKEDPNSFVSVKKTKSGHLALGFNSVSNNDGQTIVVKRSLSGKMVIEVDKSSINNLGPEKCNKEVCLDKAEQMNVPQLCKPDCRKLKKKLENKENCRVSESNEQLVTNELLTNMYDKGHRHVDVKFYRENNALINMEGTIIQMPSKTMAIHVIKENIINDRNEEFPLRVQCSESGVVNISLADANSNNAIATRTESNGFLIHIKQINTQLLKPFEIGRQKPEDMFKIKIKGLDKEVKEPPVIIKRTPSGNYDVVLEKEFEKYFMDTIQHQMVDENDSPFRLTKTSSSIILDFDKDRKNRSQSQKALLMKSDSGLLKIIVSDANQNKSVEISSNNASATFGSMISAKTLSNLLKKLPSNSKLHKDKTVKKSNASKTKSRSDSDLYETSKIKLYSNQSLLEKSSTTLKKTSLGQYAVVLDKDYKKSLINNLLSHLDKSSKGVIPVKRTKSGDIIISCTENTEIGKCGSLKISNSGNIYLILDENLVNKMYQNVAERTSSISNKTDSSQYISKIKQAENKAISTNCNAHPDSLCDASKCICESLSSKSDNVSVRFCGKSKCSGQHEKQKDSNNYKLPHIVIGPHESRLMSDEHTSSICDKTDISQYISKIKQAENKAISSNCNAHPDSLCDASKCICESISSKSDNVSVRFCGKSKCSGERDKQYDSNNNKLPHIVIGPHESRPGSDKHNKFQESYYCELQSVCPYHKCRYEAVSNELLEIFGLCNKGLGTPLSKVKTYTTIKESFPKTTVNQDWSSFDYLPHQLPPFLKNISS